MELTSPHGMIPLEGSCKCHRGEFKRRGDIIFILPTIPLFGDSFSWKNNPDSRERKRI